MAIANKINGLTLDQANILKRVLTREANAVQTKILTNSSESDNDINIPEFENICYLLEQVEQVLNYHKGQN